MVSDNMDNISHREVIHYLGLQGLTPKEIHEDMTVTLEENAPSYSMVKKWPAEFKVAGRVWKMTPVGEGESPSPHRRPLARFMTSSWQTDSN